jgi:dihydrofolate reductase
MAETLNYIGATVMDRRMFDVGEEPWGGNPPFHMPLFEVTHRAREPLVKQVGTTDTFVTSGLASAMELAAIAANY